MGDLRISRFDSGTQKLETRLAARLKIIKDLFDRFVQFLHLMASLLRAMMGLSQSEPLMAVL